MSASNIGFVSIAAMALLVAIAAVEVSQGAVPNYVLGRCDGRQDPIEDIKISSCLDEHEDGICEIKTDSPPEVELTFTPLKDIDEPISFTVTGPKNGNLIVGERSYNPCEHGARCPLKAGRAEKIVVAVKDLFKFHTVGRTTLNVHLTGGLKDSIYCVNIQAYVV